MTGIIQSSTRPELPASQPPSSTPQSNGQQVIDLTNPPSSPPASLPLQSSQSPLSPDLPPKTPVCIGQLTVAALVHDRLPYLGTRNPGETEWMPVRLQYEHNPNKMHSKDTIHIKAPSNRGPNGEIVSGKIFGVIEQKVSNSLGPMLNKGLIRLESRICKDTGSVSLVFLPSPRSYNPSIKLPILPLALLVYTPKANIPVIANYLKQCTLLLDNPTHPFDMQRTNTYHYFNPHDPPPGGNSRNTLIMPQRDHS